MLRTGSLHPSDLLFALRHRKALVLVSGVFVAILALSIAKILPLQFSSEGALVVASRQPNIPELSVAPTFAGSTSETVPTLIDVLRSKGFLEDVVHQLNLGTAANLRPVARIPPTVQDYLNSAAAGLAKLRAAVFDGGTDAAPGTGVPSSTERDAGGSAAALLYLQTHLKVEAGERSNLLSIKFSAGDPALSASVVNAVMGQYLANDQAARQAQIAQANQALSERANVLRAEVEAQDRQIANFLAGHDVDKVQGGSVAALQSSNIQAQLAAARQVLARQQAVLDTARQMTARSGNAAAATESLASPVIQSLMQREADLSQRIAGTLLYPDRIRLEDQLRNVRSQISSATDKIVAAAARDADIARANVRDLEQAVDGAKLQARGLSTADVYFAQLTRDADAKRQLFNSFLTRAEETRLATAQFPSTRILFRASAPREPDSSHLLIALVLGFFGGAFVAVAIIVFVHILRDRVNSPRDITLATGLTVFGSLPEITKRTMRRGSLLANGREQSRIHETLRAIWLATRSRTEDHHCTTLLITSSDVGEGKSTVATALARRVAADGFRVLLIGTDLRRPRVIVKPGGTSFGRLESLLAGQTTIDDAIMHDSASGLDCLLAAGGSTNPVKLLTSDGFTNLLAKVRENYDFVILDSPPVLRVADAILLSELADLILFVVQSGRMPAEMVAEAVRRFPIALRDKMLAIITRVPAGRLDRRDYYGGYGSSSAKGDLWPSGVGHLSLTDGTVAGGTTRMPENSAIRDGQASPLETIG